MWWFWIMIAGILILAFLIDVCRKRRNDDNHLPGIDSGAKPGEDSNYTMGSHRDSGGG
ncbi:hypothetical protein LCM10_12915 [Rossellomorea aquimaris]|uniref:hypothetical protein n=1 Tax=Rossellomorea aquimaris TaxID=189382 RepID=UPI001CD72F36|nr:hypothetical protein [Rossellomorea aquimaris]MCA1055892.1 hypothetical protein [Rossellomorea aquimaris]